MKPEPVSLTVAGLWHLGCVTAACCARHFQVIGYDPDQGIVERLRLGEAPILEPGLNELLKEGLKAGRLRFTSDPVEACREATLLWCTWDTPVNDQDESDVAAVLNALRVCLARMPDDALALISSQLPVGTCRELERAFPRLQFACSPENLRLGRAIEAFEHADRIVAGARSEKAMHRLQPLLQVFCQQVLWMSTESAEMVKHGLNAFLALSVSFINEIATLCEATGADARQVAAGLKSDARIGPGAYLKPGGPFAGGTLARDVVTLTRLGRQHHRPLSVIPAIKQSNDEHRTWSWRRLNERLGSLRGKRVAVLGLTYKPDTSTLRRSTAVELCRRLLEAGAEVKAFDPVIRSLEGELPGHLLAPNLETALKDADVAVVSTEWPQFREADWIKLIPLMRHRLVVDANGFLEKNLLPIEGIEHLCVGRHS